MMPANSGEETPDSLDEGLVTARFDGVVPEKSDAVLAVCEQVDAPPGHGRGGPVGAELCITVYHSTGISTVISPMGLHD